MNARVRRFLAIGVAFALTLFVVACGGGGSSSSDGSGESGDSGGGTTSEGPEVVQTGSKAGGDTALVTWDLTKGEPVSLDPAQSYNYSESTVVANMCESLFKLDENMERVPALATGVSEPNPTTLVYTIRKGVKFWDGTEMTAKDVVASLEHNLDPDTSYYLPFFGLNVKSIEQTGPFQVTVHMKQHDVTFEQALVDQMGAVSEAKALEEEGEKYGTPSGSLMCTGPFEFDHWTPGSEIVMNRNPNYWDKANAAKSKRFVFKFITDPAALQNALDSGAVDGAYGLSTTMAPALEGSDGGQLIFGEGTEEVNLVVNGSVDEPGPFQNQEVLNAFSNMIDRKALAETVFNGAAIPSNGIANPPSWGYAKGIWEAADEKLPSIEPDLEKAKKLVENAKFNERPIVFVAEASEPVNVKTCEVMVQIAEELGLQAKIEAVSEQEFNAVIFNEESRAKYDGFVGYGWNEGREPLMLMNTGFHTGLGNNFASYSNPKVDSLLDQALAQPDPTKRATLATQAQAIIAAEYPILPLLSFPNLMFEGNKIGGAPVEFVYMYSPWAAAIGAA